MTDPTDAPATWLIGNHGTAGWILGLQAIPSCIDRAECIRVKLNLRGALGDSLRNKLLFFKHLVVIIIF